MKDVIIRRLHAEDADEFSQLMQQGDSNYQQYFIPFEDTSTEAMRKMLVLAKEDRYWGIFVGEDLAGFCMLRGFDEGYVERPSIGIYVAQNRSGVGLGTLALRYCMSFCQANNVPALMLKVHPDNPGRRIWEANGFKTIGIDEKHNHLVMEKRWR